MKYLSKLWCSSDWCGLWDSSRALRERYAMLSFGTLGTFLVSLFVQGFSVLASVLFLMALAPFVLLALLGGLAFRRFLDC